jgi:hypothetical protein
VQLCRDVLEAKGVDEWFLCGPFELVQLCRDVLEAKGVDAAHVRFELFTTGRPDDAGGDRGRPVRVEAGEQTWTLDFTLDGQSTQVESPIARASRSSTRRSACDPMCRSRARAACAARAAPRSSRAACT